MTGYFDSMDTLYAYLQKKQATLHWKQTLK